MEVHEQARLDFALALRSGWARTIYPQLGARAWERCPGLGTLAADAVGEVVRQDPLYPWFAWLERGSQKLLWRAVADAVGEAAGATGEPDGGAGLVTLDLDPGLELPRWYTEWDIHLQPGGVWRDSASARVYELGAKLVMLGENDDYLFHRLFVDTAVPARGYRRIVDLGCGFGKSTRPLKQRHHGAEVIGVDLAGPLLVLAREQAERAGTALTLLQRDCRRTGLTDASVDLVTATMLIHELPVTAIVETIHEAARLLAPGGLLRILDFHLTGDPVGDLAMREHAVRNNEPFMTGLFELDLPAVCAGAGLTDARWAAFDERGAGRLPDLCWPDRPEWHFPWAVLEADKP
ncbi:MAG TPA: class I SAM-dependent methyltransferase [Streptosporangiaceae bacterium]|nr:class I SAM-dependent methyltransferase [Streptosporangiaceae bacterium]